MPVTLHCDSDVAGTLLIYLYCSAMMAVMVLSLRLLAVLLPVVAEGCCAAPSYSEATQ